MKVKNVKRGVRVELKVDQDSISKRRLGTILGFTDGRKDLVCVQWDDFANGHSQGNPTIENSVWNVWLTEIKKAPKMEK